MTFIICGVAAACTTIVFTPGASEDGSMYVTHSDDNELSDQRLVFVPAADHEPGSMQPVYCSANALGEFPQYNSFSYPRIVCDEREPTYNTPGHMAHEVGYPQPWLDESGWQHGPVSYTSHQEN